MTSSERRKIMCSVTLPRHRHHLCGLVLVCAHRPHRRGDQAGAGNRYVVRTKGVPSQCILRAQWILGLGYYSRLISRSDLQCLLEGGIRYDAPYILDVSRAVVALYNPVRGFPGNPVVKTLPSGAESSNAWGVGSIMVRELDPACLEPKHQNMQRKQYCNKFNDCTFFSNSPFVLENTV